MSVPAPMPVTAAAVRRVRGVRGLARTTFVGLVGAALSCSVAVTADAQPAQPGQSARPAAVSVSAAADYDGAVLADAPLFYWPLNEAVAPVRDATGRAAASTVTSGVLGAAGASGTGVFLDGVSQRIEVPYTAGMRLTGSFTIEVWAKLPTAPQTTGYPTLFSRGGTGPGHYGSAMWVSANAGHLVSFKRNGYDVATARGLSTAGYRQLVFVWDAAAARYTWYVDGSLDSSRPAAKLAGVDTETAPLSIGAMLPTATSSPYSYGRLLIDGLAVYPGVLPAARVAAHYTASGVKPPATATPVRRVGGVAVGDVQPWNPRRAADYAAMAAAHTTWIRTDIGWKYLQPTPDVWRWNLYEDVLADMRANGIRYLAILHTVPGWANNNTGDYGPPTNPALMDNYCYQTVRHFLPLGVTDYEIGNEVNLPHPGWTPTGATYARTLLTPCAAGARRAAAQLARPVNLLLGSMAPATDGTGQEARAFLSETYTNGGRGLTDNVAYHPYGGTTPTIDTNFNKTAADLYTIMTANGETGHKLWATEYGLPTGGDNSWGEQVQTDWLHAAFDTWYTKPFAGPLFWYSHRDTGTSATDREHHFGVLRYDGTPKPAYPTLQAHLTR
jgi:polysaccharide biosynthesis protein PslG